MNRKFDLIVFDLDGTLFDTRLTILHSLLAAFKTENIQLTDKELDDFMGPPLEASMRKHLPNLPDEKIYKLIDAYREHYINVELLNAKLFPKMDVVLQKLHEQGYKIGLATYKKLNCVTPLFEHYDILKFFDSLRGTVDGKNYTKVDIIKLVIDDCKIKDIGKVCMVGDTEHDFRGAIQCGIKFIGMTYGFGYRGMSEKELKYKEFLGYCDNAIEILDKV